MALAMLPASSRAVTVMLLRPDWRLILLDQLVVPSATLLPPRSLLQATWVTPTLSKAEPARLTTFEVVEKVEEEVGAVMVRVGLIVSAGVEIAARVGAARLL